MSTLVIDKAVRSPTPRPCIWPPCLQVANVHVSIDVCMKNLGWVLHPSISNGSILLRKLTVFFFFFFGDLFSSLSSISAFSFSRCDGCGQAFKYQFGVRNAYIPLQCLPSLQFFSVQFQPSHSKLFPLVLSCTMKS